MNRLVNAVLILFVSLISTSGGVKEYIVFLEAESFSDPGGWVIDQQSIDIMGSPYMLAHGLGFTVKDASASFSIPSSGEYKVWVRTYDWVAPWGAKGAPGKFQLLIEGKALPTVFGTEGKSWSWQYGGSTKLKKGVIDISLHDLTGFDGRCDAIILASDPEFIPPEENTRLNELRHKLTIKGIEPDDAGTFDLVVVGGGMAGSSAALTAARLGCKVALIQNRPVLGGNNSSEVRVGLSGLIYQEPFKNLGRNVDEIGSVGHWTLYEANLEPASPRSKSILETIARNPEKKIHNAGPASNYGDDKKREVIEGEPNIKLFLNTHVFSAEKENDRIVAVYGKNIITGRETKFRGRLFADCTGDANLGYMAGADFRDGREGRSETGEPSAPETPDYLVMGTSVQWYAEEVPEVSPFPDCPWAVQFNEKTAHKEIRGDWDWETGLSRNQVDEIEFIRDYALRVTFGNWDFVKNKSKNKSIYDHYKLAWVAYIGGKRESRRLIGDLVLKEQDIINQVSYPDASFTTTWSIDLHYPLKSEYFEGEPFRSTADQQDIKPYAVPFRCLYSRNISNLFMAGRNISVTHVALGTVRVQRTTGMMGEVVGMAASICRNNNVLPRDVYNTYLEDLKKLMDEGVPPKKFVEFGICTDVHKDIMHDADDRLTSFISKASSVTPDFIIQLGDFCTPKEQNRGFLNIWNGFPGDKYHVLGNHETDGGFKLEHAIKFLNSPAHYYSFDKNNFHFVVLDGNDFNPSPDKAPGYARFIGEEQRNWLINDLKSTNKKVIIFTHQSLEGEGIENREQIRNILENENNSSGFRKVIACFSGHHHTDYSTSINGINYIQINSMSYSWVGEKYEKIRYSTEIDIKYPWIKYTIPYKDPLYAFVEINDSSIVITGIKSTFVGPGPDESGIPERPDNDKITPVISDRYIRY